MSGLCKYGSCASSQLSATAASLANWYTSRTVNKHFTSSQHKRNANSTKWNWHRNNVHEALTLHKITTETSVQLQYHLIWTYVTMNEETKLTELKVVPSVIPLLHDSSSFSSQLRKLLTNLPINVINRACMDIHLRGHDGKQNICQHFSCKCRNNTHGCLVCNKYIVSHVEIYRHLIGHWTMKSHNELVLQPTKRWYDTRHQEKTTWQWQRNVIHGPKC